MIITKVKAALPALTFLSSLFDEEKMLKNEQIAIKKATKLGFNNPLKDEDRTKSLTLANNERRYILDFIVGVDYSSLDIPDQIRAVQIDEKDCQARIIPSIETHGLRNPILVKRSIIPNMYDIVHGHNTAWSMNRLGLQIPVFVVSDAYKSNGEDGSPLSDLLSRLHGNRVMKNRQYGLDDAVLGIKEAFKLDNTFDGQNPTGHLPPRESDTEFDWNDLMDILYGPTGHFLHKGKRTQIRNLYMKGTGGNKLLPMTENDVTATLENHRWDPGLSPTNKRKSTLKHIDRKRKAIIVVSDSNGDNLDTKLLKILKAEYLDKDFQDIMKEYNIEYIDIFQRIYKPSTNAIDLKTAKAVEVKRVKEFNDFLKKIGSSFRIRELILPKHLDDNNDKEMVIDIFNS